MRHYNTGQASGSAYLFTRDVVDGVASSSWTQRAKLVAGDGAARDEFGRNVSVCNDTVVAGAWGNDANVGRCRLTVSYVLKAPVFSALETKL